MAEKKDSSSRKKGTASSKRGGVSKRESSAPHQLHEVVRALQRSLSKVEKELEAGEDETKFTVSHFEIEFPAELAVAPLKERGTRGLAATEAKDHATVRLPESKTIAEEEGAQTLEKTIPDSNLSRVKVILRRSL